MFARGRPAIRPQRAEKKQAASAVWDVDDLKGTGVPVRSKDLTWLPILGEVRGLQHLTTGHGAKLRE